MEIPQSMFQELGEWNDGKGIDLYSWVGCTGNFSLAVGYATVFWPELEEINGYILPKGTTLDAIHGFESQKGATRHSVEAVLNHLHLVDIQYAGCPDCTPDKLLALGHVLKEIYEAKLVWQFPNQPCLVELIVPDDPNDLNEYQLTFWQKAHESPSA